MSIHTLTSDRLRRPGPVTLETDSIPSPTGGMDARQNIAAESMSECVYVYNMTPAEYGLEIRSGYQRYQSSVNAGASEGVRTIVPYTGVVGDGTDDRLFAVNNEGIWDVSVYGAVPSSKLAFTTQSGDAGWGQFTHYDTDAGAAIVFYADAVNGLFQYDPGADAWTQPAGITGVDVALINYVMVHKQRIWFGVQNSSTGYYLDVGAIAGAATPFHFGNNFPHGGDLVALVRWTLDAGIGIDDYLVAISRGGDVTPWQGSDPTASNWSLVGAFFIGELPKGNRVTADFGGDILLLSEFGITSMSDLLRSSSAVDPSERSIAFRIARLIREDMRLLRYESGWEMTYLASQGILVLNTPRVVNQPAKQYAMSRTTVGWCYWNSVPMAGLAQWRGEPYFGTRLSNVEVMNTDTDAAVFTDSAGIAIQFSLLTNYTSLNSRGSFKRCEFIRPTFVGTTPTTYRVTALYDYAITASDAPPALPQTGDGSWDVTNWDESTWVLQTPLPSYEVRGASNIGRSVAVEMAGSGYSETRLTSIDLGWRPGGFL